MQPPMSHNWLFSRQCLLCNLHPGQPWLCQRCEDDLPHLFQHCPLCGLALPHSQRCGQCLKKPPPWHQITVAFHYAFPINALISQAKYDQQHHFIPALAALLSQRIAPHPQQGVIVPVPMSARKLRQRHANHAFLLAQQLGQRLNLRVASHAVVKIRDTVQQKDLNRQVRQQNLRGSFAVREALPDEVIVVDDVITTGSTLAEITRLLMAHGVQKVTVWVIARTPEPGSF